MKEKLPDQILLQKSTASRARSRATGSDFLFHLVLFGWLTVSSIATIVGLSSPFIDHKFFLLIMVPGFSLILFGLVYFYSRACKLECFIEEMGMVWNRKKKK